MKKKFLKAMACAMSVCMLSMSLAGCGDEPKEESKPADKSQESSKEESKAGDDQQASGDQSSEEQQEEVDPNENLFPAYDFGGVELTVLDHNGFWDLNPDAEGLEADKKADRQANKDRIEEKYNVKLTFVGSPTDSWDDIDKEVVKGAIAKAPVADIMSAYYTFVGTYYANDILYDFTQDFANSDVFKDANQLVFGGKALGVTQSMGGEGLYYNADMIHNAGMEYTPAEMFDRGMWSYDDMYQYLLDLKSKLGENEYPLFVSPYYWMLFGCAANGTSILDPSGNLNYCTDAMMECLEFYKKCVDNGLNAVPKTTKEDGSTGYNNWGYPGETFDQGNTVAIAHRAGWQVANCPDKFDLEFVPYPWGKNVTIDASKKGEPGAYKTLSDNYAVTTFDGKLTCMVKSITEKGVKPMEVMSMLCDWQNWGNVMADYVEPPKDETDDYPSWLESGTISKELYQFSSSRERLEIFNTIYNNFDGFSMNLTKTMYEGSSVRSAMESFYNQDMSLMIELGFSPESVYKPFDVEEGDAE